MTIRLSLLLALSTLPSGLPSQEVPTTKLGRARTTFDEPFSRISAVREEPDGRVLVLDNLENRLDRVDLRTSTAAPVGRQGNGPGEYLLPLYLLALAGDTTLAIDMYGRGRALLMVARGATDRRITAKGSASNAPLFNRPDVQADARGSLYELVRLSSPADREGGYSAIQRFNRTTGRRDTIGRVSQRVRSPLIKPASATPSSGVERSMGGPPPPYSSLDQWAVAPDGRVAMVTVDPYRVRLIEPGGRVVDGPVSPYRAVPMSADLKAAWRWQQEQPVSTLLYGRDGSVTAGRQRIPYKVPLAWPPVLPPFLPEALRFAPDGTLWIERAGLSDAGKQFDVIDVRGQLVRRVAFPVGVRLLGFGRNAVYTVRRDADDLEYLQVHEWRS